MGFEEAAGSRERAAMVAYGEGRAKESGEVMRRRGRGGKREGGSEGGRGVAE